MQKQNKTKPKEKEKAKQQQDVAFLDRLLFSQNISIGH